MNNILARNSTLLSFTFIFTLLGGCSSTKQPPVAEVPAVVDDSIYYPYKENVDLLNTIRSTSTTKDALINLLKKLSQYGEFKKT